MQDLETKRKIIETIVYKDYTPKLVDEFARVTNLISTQAVDSYKASELVGSPVIVNNKEQIKLEIFNLSKQLIDNIMVIVHDEKITAKKNEEEQNS